MAIVLNQEVIKALTLLDKCGNCLRHTALTSPGFFLTILLILVFGWAWCSLCLITGIGRGGRCGAAQQVAGIYTSLFQHLGELGQLTLIFCLLCTFFLCGFKALCINLLKLFFSFFQLFK